LIAKPVLSAAIRALPGYSIAGHSPDIFIHTSLANRKATPACPAERHFFFAAVTDIFSELSAPFSVFSFRWRI